MKALLKKVVETVERDKFPFLVFIAVVSIIIAGSSVFSSGRYTWTKKDIQLGVNYYLGASAITSDGTKIAIIGNSDDLIARVLVSTDSGSNWVTSVGSNLGYNLVDLTASDDHQKISVVPQYGAVYTLTSYGAWTPGNTTKWWAAIDSSSDGTKLAAAATSNDYVYTSTDSGSSWTARNGMGAADWRDITISSDGTKIAVIGAYENIWTSVDSGANWTEQTSSGQKNWSSIAGSSDGTKLVAAETTGYIYTSTTSGATWATSTNAGSANWFKVESSSDGTKLVATGSGGIFTSNDSGLTWVTESTGWGVGVKTSISPDGSHLVNNVSNSYIVVGIPDVTPPIFSSAYVDGNTLEITYDENLDPNQTPIASDIAVTGDEGDSCSASSVTVSATKITATLSCSMIKGESTTLSYGGTWIKDFSGNSAAVLTNQSISNYTTGYVWTKRTSAGLNSNRFSIDYSGDGTNLITAILGGYIYTSQDSGATWATSTNAGTSSWTSVAASYDGTKLLATIAGGAIKQSIDSGSTWTSTGAPNKAWYSVTGDDDFTHMLASFDLGAYYSTTSGSTWAQIPAFSTQSQGVSISSNGSKMFVMPIGNQIIYSTTSGAVWAKSGSSGIYQPSAASADGTNVFSGGFNYLYRSTTSGSVWVNSTAPYGSVKSLAVSSDGQKLFAATRNFNFLDFIYISLNSGETWYKQLLPNRIAPRVERTSALTSTADGLKLALANASDGYIYTAEASADQFTVPSVELTAPANGAHISGLTVPITASTTDDTGISWVKFYYGNNLIIKDTSAPYTVNWDSRNADDGSVILKAVARDVYNNRATSTITVTVDNLAPSVSISSPADSSTVLSTAWSPSVSWDDASTCHYSYDGGSYISMSCNNSIPAPSTSGSHTLTIRGADQAGNIETDSVSFTYVLPLTVSITRPSGSITSWSPSISWGTAVTCEYKYDGGSYNSMSCNNSLPESSSGSHTLTIRGTDAFSNTDTDSKSFTYTPYVAPTPTPTTNDSHMRFSGFRNIGVLGNINLNPLPQVTLLPGGFGSGGAGATILPEVFANLQPISDITFPGLPKIFLNNISNFVSGPIPDIIAQTLQQSQSLKSMFASLGMIKPQSFASLENYPILLTTPLDQPTPTDLFVIKSGSTNLPVYATYDRSVGLAELIKVSANQILEISVVPLKAGPATATFQDQTINLISDGQFVSTSVVSPATSGRYIFKTSAATIPLIIEVSAPVETQTGAGQKKPGLFGELWKSLNNLFSRK